MKTGGAVVCWRDEPDPVVEFAPPTGAFRQLSMREFYACGVETEGTIRCWGGDSPGPPGLLRCWGDYAR